MKHRRKIKHAIRWAFCPICFRFEGMRWISRGLYECTVCGYEWHLNPDKGVYYK